MKEKEIYELLASHGIRLFALSLGSDQLTFIHHNKTVEEWRTDIRNIISEIKHLRDKSGRANDEVYNKIAMKLMQAGYCEVDDVVSDVYEGRVAVYSAGIEDDPAHRNQEDGFGHYGWGALNIKNNK
jgi:hypothetical protein